MTNEDKAKQALDRIEGAMPHIRVAMGHKCDPPHPTDRCSSCWVDVYYEDLKNGIFELKELVYKGLLPLDG